jgi:hypothetical protein
MTRPKALPAAARSFQVGPQLNVYCLLHGSLIPGPIERTLRELISEGAIPAFGRFMRYSRKDGDCFPSEADPGRAFGCSTKQGGNPFKKRSGKHFIAKRQHGLEVTKPFTFLWRPFLAEEKRHAPDSRQIPGRKGPTGLADRMGRADQGRKDVVFQGRKQTAFKENRWNPWVADTKRGGHS